MTDAFVHVDRDGAVDEIVIDRSDRHNSLVPGLLADLRAAVADAGERDDVRAAVVRTAGESFSTGGDVRAIHDHRDALGEYADRLVGELNGVIRGMLACPVPIVIGVDGIVSGGSVGFLLGADVVYLSPGATVTPHYAEVGFSPDGGWTALMPTVIGRRRTAEVLVADRTIQPDEAVAWGLASAVVEEPVDRARGAARAIADRRPGAIRHASALLEPDGDRVAADLARERRRFVDQVQTEEALAGMRAFLRG